MGGGKEFKDTLSFFRRFSRSGNKGPAPDSGPVLSTTENHSEDQDAAFAASGIVSVDDVASIASVDDNVDAAALDNKDGFVEVSAKDTEAKTIQTGKTDDALDASKEKIEAIKAIKRFELEDDLVLNTLAYVNDLQTANNVLRGRVAMPGNTILNPENREAVKVITEALENQDRMCRLLMNFAVNITLVKRIVHDGDEIEQPEQE